MKYFKILCVVFFVNACNTVDYREKATWRAVYKNDQNGETVSGNIDTLIAGIRAGYDVRVGWGWQREQGDSTLSLEHIATPIYMSIIQEKHVSAIIDAHPLLESYRDIDKQRFGAGGHTWQCILTTKGTFNAQVYDRVADTLLNDWPQKHTITWFLDCPADANLSTTQALY